MEVEGSTMDVVLALAEPLISNAIAVFSIMDKPEKLDDAEKLLAWIIRHRKTEFSLRELFRDHQSRFREMAAMLPAVVLLQEHGYIRPKRQEKKSGRPTEIFEVNPEAYQG
jgi:hypothetical protein